MTYEDITLNKLKTGAMLSKRDIGRITGCLNQGMPIYNLRQKGFDIRTMMKTADSGKRFAVYYLVAENIRRVF